MGCGQSKTEQKVTKETRTAVSQSPQRADTTATQVEKTATTTTTTTTATNNTTGENADKKNAVGDVILVGKLKNKNAANTDTKDKETKETTTTTEKHTGDDGKEVKEVHEKTKEVKTAAPATTTTTTTAAKRAADKKKNACADEVVDKIKLSSPTVKKREEREAAAFAERMLEQNGYVNDEQPAVTYVDPMNEEQPIINEPCEVYISPENNMTITSSSNNNTSQNAHPAEPSCNMSSSAQNSTSISPPPQPNENATPYKEPLVQTKVIATRVYEIDNGKSPEPIPQQSNVHQDNKTVHEHGEHHSTTHPDHLQHSAAHHTSPETKEHNGSHRMSTPRRGSGSMPDGARGASKTTGTTHPTPKDKSSTARSLAKLHTTATSRLVQQYADQQQQQQRRRSSSASQPHDEKQKTPEPKHEKIKPATKVATTTTAPPPAMAGDSEHPHPHTNTHHHHHSINNDKENNEVHHKSTHSASPESKPTKETCVVKTNEMNGTKNQSGKPASALEVTKLQHQQQKEKEKEKEEEKITMPEVVKDEQANDEANASENAEGQSSGPETSTLRQLYNRIASFTRILPTTPSRSQSQAQADSDAVKQQVESVEQKKEEVVECQPEQPHPSHEPAVEHENEQKLQHHHRKHDEEEKEKQQQQQKQKEKEEEEKKKKKEEEKEEEEKKEEEQENDDQEPESEQPPSHYWRHSQSISGPTSYAADNAPTLVKTANGTSKHNAAVKEPVPTTTPAAAAVTTNTMHNKPLSEAVEREKLRHSRRTRKTAAQKYNVLYNLENDAASTITAQSYRPKYNHLVRAQAMNSKGSMASQRSAELKESTFEKKLRQREAEAQAEAGEQARAFSPEAATQPEEKPAGPMWVTVIPQDDAAVNMSGGWGLLRQIRTLIQLSHTAAV